MADTDGTAPTQLPDDIEQKLMDGQRLRATHDLMARRGISLDAARTIVGRWLAERPNRNGVASAGPCGP
jgi:hypothetical protein